MDSRSKNGGHGRSTKAEFLRSTPASALSDATSQVSHLAERVREESREYLAARKSDAAAELTKVGSAIRQAADKLNDQSRTAVARYVENAAETVEDAGRYLKQVEFNQLLDDAQRLARQQPALFLGGMFIAGLAVARFAKVAIASASQEPRQQESSRGRTRHAGRQGA